MKRILIFVMLSVLSFCWTGCSKEGSEPYVVQTYERNVEDAVSNPDFKEEVVYHTYYKMNDGTWKTEDHSYQYCLEITGQLHNAVKDTTYIYLSNIEDISFEQAWKASGLSSLTTDYFKVEDAILVGMIYPEVEIIYSE